jgi:ribose 5-phosphate isomerase A
VDIADQVIIGHPDGACELRDLSDGSAQVSHRQVELAEASNIFNDI